jgi:hypothetical protein
VAVSTLGFVALALLSGAAIAIVGLDRFLDRLR